MERAYSYTRPQDRHRPSIRRMLAGLMALAVVATPAAASDKPMDAVLLLDSSGSMRHTDPDRLRVPAAKLFISLLGRDDRVGVVSFSDQGWPIAGLTPVRDGQPRERLLRAVEAVSSKGALTNLHAAVKEAQAMLSSETGDRRRYILLMSDGHMDVGNKAEDTRLTAAVREELLPALRAQGIHLYTVAFTQASDTGLLRTMAKQTDGQYRLARTNDALHQVFATLFESAKQPDMLPVEHGRFVVDEAVQEATIVVSKTPDANRVTLESPSGQRLAQDTSRQEVRWFESPGFDMVTIHGPAAGRWVIHPAQGADRAYVVTDLGLEYELDPADPAAGTRPTLRAWLTKDGERLTRYEILVNTEFSARLSGAGDAVTRVPLDDSGQGPDGTADDGVFTGRLPVSQPGAHELAVVAESATFERQRSYHFQAAKAAPQPAPEHGARNASTPPSSQSDAQDSASPEAAGESSPEFMNIWQVLGLFLVANLLLAGGAGAIVATVIYRRRRKSEAREDAGEQPPESSPQQPASADAAPSTEAEEPDGDDFVAGPDLAEPVPEAASEEPSASPQEQAVAGEAPEAPSEVAPTEQAPNPPDDDAAAEALGILDGDDEAAAEQARGAAGGEAEEPAADPSPDADDAGDDSAAAASAEEPGDESQDRNDPLQDKPGSAEEQTL